MELRTCKCCGETKEAVQGTWPQLYGLPYKKMCCACVAADYRARRLDPERGAKIRENTRKGNAKLRATPEGLAKHHASSLDWQVRNKGRCAAKSKKRRTSKLNRMPGWLTEADLKAIEDKYIVAQWFSYIAMMPYHVDHVIPLQGANVSGLHVPSNLCIRLGVENLSKGNKWVP